MITTQSHFFQNIKVLILQYMFPWNKLNKCNAIKINIIKSYWVVYRSKRIRLSDQYCRRYQDTRSPPLPRLYTHWVRSDLIFCLRNFNTRLPLPREIELLTKFPQKNSQKSDLTHCVRSFLWHFNCRLFHILNVELICSSVQSCKSARQEGG